LTGSTDQIVERIGEYADAGAEAVNVALRAPFDVESLDRFAAEVLPAFP
jgi:alkanesulfonate monooxygenase SsuD/methylene tetrahydromethanopterin reductase-like flavin-dependent oxidoreductase (luciferase family)